MLYPQLCRLKCNLVQLSEDSSILLPASDLQRRIPFAAMVSARPNAATVQTSIGPKRSCRCRRAANIATRITITTVNAAMMLRMTMQPTIDGS